MPGPYVCSTSRIRQKFVCCSCVCHGLEAHLYILPLILDLLWRELFSNFPFFTSLLLSKAGLCLIMGFPLFGPFFAYSVILLPFLSYHSAIPIVVFFNPCFLGLFWACCLFFSQWLNMVIEFILMLLWAFLTHYIACGPLCPISFFLGILGPFAFLEHPWPIF